jgi:SET domain-containing protein
MPQKINDDPNPNCEMKIVVVDHLDHFCLFSTRDIGVGEELFFDYGPHNNTSWRKEDVSCMQNFLKKDQVRIQICSHIN